jgi:hypothetical protein
MKENVMSAPPGVSDLNVVFLAKNQTAFAPKENVAVHNASQNEA